MNPQQRIEQFKEVVWQYYSHNKRDMPWRTNTSFYYILVSEIMLQQTQVASVIPKFNHFISLFPDFESLATSDTKSLLGAWSGLGYNNRALRLRECAKIISADTRFIALETISVEMLDELPGIGHATASAISVYVYNTPQVFIETNIRRVFIHHFFGDQTEVDDKQLTPVIAESLDLDNPREWYWALMDYGSFLKTQVPNPNRRSKTYSKQSKFEGSVRQVRGEILRRLQRGEMTKIQITSEFGERGEQAIDGLIKDKVLSIQQDRLILN